jgi:hypothetical protein
MQRKRKIVSRYESLTKTMSISTLKKFPSIYVIKILKSETEAMIGLCTTYYLQYLTWLDEKK